MGAETRDIDNVALLLVVPDISVSDPLLSDSLISVGRLMEAGFKVLFLIPCEAHLDGFTRSRYPKYGGKITTPQGRVIIMDYESHTWRLPPPLISKTVILKPTPVFNSFLLGFLSTWGRKLLMPTTTVVASLKLISARQ